MMNLIEIQTNHGTELVIPLSFGKVESYPVLRATRIQGHSTARLFHATSTRMLPPGPETYYIGGRSIWYDQNGLGHLDLTSCG